MGNACAPYVSVEMENGALNLVIDPVQRTRYPKPSATQAQTTRDFFFLLTRLNSYIQPLAMKYAKPAKIWA